MKAPRNVLVMTVAIVLARPLFAAPVEGDQRPPVPGPAAQRINRMLGELTLTDDQKAKLAAVEKEFGPQFAEAIKRLAELDRQLQQSVLSVLTDEQKPQVRKRTAGEIRTDAEEPLTGTIVIDGKPARKVRIVFRPEGKGDAVKTETDETGKFSGSLKAGTYRVEVGPTTKKRPLENEPMGPQKADKGAAIAGRLTFQGQPVNNAQVIFHSVGKGAAATLPTDDSGAFTGRLPVGQYQVAIRLIGEGRKFLPAKYASPETSGLMVEIAPGRNEFNFDLR